ncbi:MAG TPA: RDD family protein [Polyangiaceae bacterium]|nr:RDD family protein [Polyangiaceae bacterium]
MSQLENPYAPPEADDEPAPSSAQEVVVASQGQRFANFVVDSIASRIVAALPMIIPEMPPAVGGILGVTFFFGYYLVGETAFRATLGKLITKTRVVAANGGSPRFTQILGRTFARFVPFEPFSYLSRSPVGWHDRWSGTRVVTLSSLREN